MRKYYTDKHEEKELLKEAERMLPGFSELAQDKLVLFSSGKIKEVFLVSEELFKNFLSIKPRHPYSLGFFVGTKGKFFYPSLQTAYEYAKNFSTRKIIVSKTAEKHFTYNNNLEKQMVTSISPDLSEGDFGIVCNEQNEALGYGFLVVSPENAKPGNLFIKNLKNVSSYLKNKFT